MTDIANSTIHVPVLVVGCGSVGPALACELGWRGVRCLVIDDTNGTVDHPKANAENSRTMEMFRRWDVAETVRREGTPEDYPHTSLYLTCFNGFEIARIERPHHGGRGATRYSPERPQRCNQIWLNPILAKRAAEFPSITIRWQVKFEGFEDRGDSVVASIRDLKTGERQTVVAQYLVDCSGGHSPIRAALNVKMLGDPSLDYNVNIFFKVNELWSYHKMGKGALHTFIGPEGNWANLTQLDGRELWRLGVRGKQYFDDTKSIDVDHEIFRIVGKKIPYELLSVRRWIARDLVAEKYRWGRVFLCGDSAHENTPSGGHGLNTGIGDVSDLGWMLEATLAGWGGPKLLDAYTVERQPIGIRNVGQATQNYKTSRGLVPGPHIADDTPEGAAARRSLGDAIVQTMTRGVVSDGTALGYIYDGSPIICDDGTPRPPDTITDFQPTTRPGARAPHAWLADGRSTIDLYGRGFTLMVLGPAPPETGAMEQAFASRKVPLTVVRVPDAEIAKLYERKLVLVRPDGHAAWRGDTAPVDPLTVADRVRGAA